MPVALLRACGEANPLEREHSIIKKQHAFLFLLPYFFLFFSLPLLTLFKQLHQLYYADLQACRASELGRQGLFSQVLTALISWRVRVEKLPVELHFCLFFLPFFFFLSLRNILNKKNLLGINNGRREECRIQTCAFHTLYDGNKWLHPPRNIHRQSCLFSLHSRYQLQSLYMYFFLSLACVCACVPFIHGTEETFC